MTHAKSIGMRSVAAGDDASAQPVGRKGLFARFLEALHASRRRQAQRYIYSYRYLLAEEYPDRPQVVAIDPGKTEQGQADANSDKTSLRDNHRMLEGA